MGQKAKTNQLDPVTHQSGWGYIQISSTVSSTSTAVTFPTAMASVPKSIVATLTGYRATGSGAPSSLADFTQAYGNNYSQTVFIRNASTTGFTLDISAGTSNSIGASYIGYSWMAEA